MSRVRLMLACALAACAAGCAPEPSIPPATDLSRWEALSLADGTPRQFDAREGPVLLNVWATWCEPCRREMASLEAAHRSLEARGIRVIGVNVDTDVLLAREYARRAGLTFTNVSDPEQLLVRGRLGVKSLPTTLGVDAGGATRWRDERPRDWSEPARLAWIERTVGPQAR